MYRTTRDTRNSPLWNPSSNKLQNLEDDEAGRLAAFRARFGRSWDATTVGATPTSTSAPVSGVAETPDAVAATTTTAEEVMALKKEKEEGEKAKLAAAAAAAAQEQEEEDNLLDLISSFGQEEAENTKKK